MTGWWMTVCPKLRHVADDDVVVDWSLPFDDGAAPGLHSEEALFDLVAPFAGGKQSGGDELIFEDNPLLPGDCFGEELL